MNNIKNAGLILFMALILGRGIVFAHGVIEEKPTPGAVEKPVGNPKEVEREARAALGFITGLLKLSEDMFPDLGQHRQIYYRIHKTLSLAVYRWGHGSNSTNQQAMLNYEYGRCLSAMTDLAKILEKFKSIEPVQVQGGAPIRRRIVHRLMYEDGVVMLRMTRQPQSGAAGVQFFRADLDPAKPAEVTIDLGNAEPAYVALFISKSKSRSGTWNTPARAAPCSAAPPRARPRVGQDLPALALPRTH